MWLSHYRDTENKEGGEGGGQRQEVFGARRHNKFGIERCQGSGDLLKSAGFIDHNYGDDDRAYQHNKSLNQGVVGDTANAADGGVNTDDNGKKNDSHKIVNADEGLQNACRCHILRNHIGDTKDQNGDSRTDAHGSILKAFDKEVGKSDTVIFLCKGGNSSADGQHSYHAEDAGTGLPQKGCPAFGVVKSGGADKSAAACPRSSPHKCHKPRTKRASSDKIFFRETLGVFTLVQSKEGNADKKDKVKHEYSNGG